VSFQEARFLALTEKWMEVIGRDVHKDRDCHFHVEKTWSYGQEPIYVAAHYGYIGPEFTENFSTYRAALTYMIGRLTEMIEGEAQEAA
jgi:hypothetical protein